MTEQDSTSPAPDWEADPCGVVTRDEDGGAVGSRLRKPREYVDMAQVEAAIARTRARWAEGWMQAPGHAVVRPDDGDGWIHTSWLGGLVVARRSASEDCDRCIFDAFALTRALLPEPGEITDRYEAAIARLEAEGK